MVQYEMMEKEQNDSVNDDQEGETRHSVFKKLSEDRLAHSLSFSLWLTSYYGSRAVTWDAPMLNNRCLLNGKYTGPVIEFLQLYE